MRCPESGRPWGRIGRGVDQCIGCGRMLEVWEDELTPEHDEPTAQWQKLALSLEDFKIDVSVELRESGYPWIADEVASRGVEWLSFYIDWADRRGIGGGVIDIAALLISQD